VAQLVVIVEVFAAERDPLDALPDQSGDRMFDEPRVSGVAETSRQSVDEMNAPVGRPQQQPARV